MKRKGSFFSSKRNAREIENEQLRKVDGEDELEGEREDEDEVAGERKEMEGENEDEVKGERKEMGGENKDEEGERERQQKQVRGYTRPRRPEYSSVHRSSWVSVSG